MARKKGSKGFYSQNPGAIRLRDVTGQQIYLTQSEIEEFINDDRGSFVKCNTAMYKVEERVMDMLIDMFFNDDV